MEIQVIHPRADYVVKIDLAVEILLAVSRPLGVGLRGRRQFHAP